MTRGRAKELLPVVQAWAEGKVVQFKDKSQSMWHDSNDDLGFYESCDYRIKPEPKRVWVNVYGPNRSVASVHESFEGARRTCGTTGEIVEFVEVV